MAVTILTCSSLEDRTSMLNYWIEIAIESKTALGNMYGFAGLMLGLCTPQVISINRLVSLHNINLFSPKDLIVLASRKLPVLTKSVGDLSRK